MNHKRLFSLLLSLVLLLGMVPAITVSAAETASGTCGENLTWTLVDGVLTISGSGKMDDFESKNSPWYEYRNSITEIIIGDEVTSIGEYAFKDCRSVLELTIPASVKLIGYLAFDTAYNIDFIMFLGDAPELVTSKVSDGCIYNGHPFNGIVATVYYPAENATWTESCRESFSPFRDSFSWIALSESELNATLPVSDTCGKNVTWTLTEDGVLTISGSGRMDDYEYAMNPWFRFRKHITSVVIEEGVTYIGEHALHQCNRLSDVTMAKSVKTIGSYAFSNCDALDGITIGAGVTRINYGAFNYSYHLTSVYFLGDKPEFNDENLIGTEYVEVGIFSGVTANVYYPKDNATWNRFMYEGFGGKLTWDKYDPAASHIHKYTRVITKPTCTEGGYTTYTCACGDSYVTDEKKATGHNFQDGYCQNCHLVDPDVVRLAGANRWATSLAVADEMKENLGIEKFDAVIIASGDNFADALAGSYLSAVKSAPILLCWNGGGRFEYLNQNILDYIDANLAEDGTVYILGGKGAVPMSFDEKLGDRVNRLNGSNRFETNLMILKEAGVKAGEEILVCTSTNFADSLSASATGKPILLVFNEGGKLFDNQIAYLETLSGNTFTILGGNGAVSEKLAGLIGAYGTVSRLAGANRFETSVLVAEKYFSNPDSVVLAYAWNYPDGLCGGSLAYSLNAPLILTMAKYEASATKYIGKNSISTGTVLGGPSLIPDDSIDKLYSESKA